MSAGRIYGIAGNGLPGYTGDGGPATAARVGQPPGGLAFDGSGNLVLADTGNNRIRMVAATLRHLLRAGHDRRGHLHRGRHRHRRVLRRRRPGQCRRTERARCSDGGHGGQPGARRHRQQPDPDDRGHLGHLLRHRHDRRGHLHRGRHRHGRVLRRRRARDRREAPGAGLGGHRRGGQPGARRHRQQPDPDDRGHLRHLLRHRHDRRGHLHGGRHRHAPGTPATAARPPRPSCGTRWGSPSTARGTCSSPTPATSGCGWSRLPRARTTARP